MFPLECRTAVVTGGFVLGFMVLRLAIGDVISVVTVVLVSVARIK
jgi:hypothetical protein